MATYHLSVKHGKKGNGQLHSEYITREGVYRHGAQAAELVYKESGNMPEWAKDNPRDYWKAADDFEIARGRSYSEFEIALPNELTREQNIELVQDFIRQHIGENKAYTFAIHEKAAALDPNQRQPHAHVMFSEKIQDGIERGPEQFFKQYRPKNIENGGAKKDDQFTSKQYGPENIKAVREAWEQHQNKALEMYGHEARVDHRSNEARGIDRPAEQHLGPSVADKLQKGEVVNEKAAQVQAVRELKEQEKKVAQLEAEKVAQAEAEATGPQTQDRAIKLPEKENQGHNAPEVETAALKGAGDGVMEIVEDAAAVKREKQNPQEKELEKMGRDANAARDQGEKENAAMVAAQAQPTGREEDEPEQEPARSSGPSLDDDRNDLIGEGEKGLRTKSQEATTPPPEKTAAPVEHYKNPTVAEVLKDVKQWRQEENKELIAYKQYLEKQGPPPKAITEQQARMMARDELTKGEYKTFISEARQQEKDKEKLGEYQKALAERRKEFEAMKRPEGLSGLFAGKEKAAYDERAAQISKWQGEVNAYKGRVEANEARLLQKKQDFKVEFDKPENAAKLEARAKEIKGKNEKRIADIKNVEKAVEILNSRAKVYERLEARGYRNQTAQLDLKCPKTREAVLERSKDILGQMDKTREAQRSNGKSVSKLDQQLRGMTPDEAHAKGGLSAKINKDRDYDITD